MNPRLLLLVCVASASACLPETGYRETERRVDPPLEKVHVFGPSMSIYPAADWRELVDLSLFGRLRPQVTFADAVRLAGQPDERGESERGPFYAYKSQTAFVTVAFEKHGSTVGSYTTWALRAKPYRLKIEEFFRPSIVEEIRRTPEVGEVTIMKWVPRDPALSVDINAGYVTAIHWVRE